MGSVPPFSDGNSEYIRLGLQNGWSSADQYISSYFNPANRELHQLFARYKNQLVKTSRIQQQYDMDGNPIIGELPHGYSLMAGPSGGSLLIVGHPRYIQNIALNVAAIIILHRPSSFLISSGFAAQIAFRANACAVSVCNLLSSNIISVRLLLSKPCLLYQQLFPYRNISNSRNK
jgi:hypothetical protein